MTSDDREKIKIIIDEPKKGSFEANIFIQLIDNILAVSPLLAENGIAIWEYITQAYEYLKLFIDTRKKGKEVTVPQDDNHNIIVTGDSNQITVNNQVPELAKNLSPHMSNMAQNIDDDNISEVNLYSADDEGFNLTIEDKERFKSKTFLNSEYIEYKGKIVSSDSKRHKGEIETKEGLYTFFVHDSIASESFHDDVYLKNVKFKCHEKIKIDPSLEEMEKILSIEVYEYDLL